MENKINTIKKIVAEQLEIYSRLEVLPKQEGYCTVKDHKPNFPNNVKTRLINPSKPQIARVGKRILDDINTALRDKTKLNQMQSTGQVIKSFMAREPKCKWRFIIFDIENFYPSISEKLLDSAIMWAKSLVIITNQDIEIIRACCQDILFASYNILEKSSTGTYDVTMGSFAGGELCELIGLFLLHLLSLEGIEAALYRDDGAVLTKSAPRQVQKLAEKITRIFKSKDLAITIEANLNTINFLDVTLDCDSNQYSPFVKDNHLPLYVHKESNHPPRVLKNIPEGVERRISNLSSSEAIFFTSKAIF